MLSTQIKEATKLEHQETEKKVVFRIKSIANDMDYIAFLKCFYAYFNAIEQSITSYINTVLPDYKERRNSSYIKADIEELGGRIEGLPTVSIPEVNDALQSMGALYVLEGSIMGGVHIVQMLQKKGITKGFSFFSGYGKETTQKWTNFTQVLNNLPQSEQDRQRVIATATVTFRKFGEVFHSTATT